MRPRAARLAAWAACLAGAVLAAAPASALDVYIAPIAVLDESETAGPRLPDPARALYALLSERAFDGKVIVRLADMPRTGAPRSLLEALRLADSAGYPYLLYGYLRRTEDLLVLELKLLDREARAVGAVFFGGDASGRRDRLMADMDAKIAAYFKETLDAGPGGKAGTPDRERVWSLPVSLGCWAAASEGWGEVLSGLVRARAGVRFRPRMPAYVRNSRKHQLGFGTDLEYGLGIGAPGIEEAVLHSVLWRIVGDWTIELDDRHNLGASAGPFGRMDVLCQSRKYAERRTDLSACLGFGLEAQYAYRLSDRVSVGATLGLDLSFYAEPLATIRPGLRAEYRFPGGGEDGR